jgi:exosome complex component RRP41
MGPLNNNINNGMAGSALVEMGLTTVLATVRGPMECTRRFDEMPNQCIVQVQVKTAPFASSSLSSSISTNPNTDRRLIEASHMIKRAMEAFIYYTCIPSVALKLYSSCCKAINAATLAILNTGIPVKDFCCACSVGHAATASNSTGSSTSELGRRLGYIDPVRFCTSYYFLTSFVKSPR